MADSVDTTTKDKPLKRANIEDPRVLAEQVLLDRNFNGSITLKLPDAYPDPDQQEKTVTIPFYLDNNFSFSLGNDWGSLVPNVAGEFLSTLVNLFSMSDMANTGAQMQVVSRSMQTLAWKGSQNPEFTIGTTFVATRRSYNPVDIIRALSACCLPLSREEASAEANKTADLATGKVENAKNSAVEGISKLNSDFAKAVDKPLTSAVNHLKKAGLIAPLEYKPVVDFENDNVVADLNSGTVELYIGKWFHASKLVIKSMSNIEFSREIIAPQPNWLYGNATHNNIYHKNLTMKEKQNSWGFPVYAKCNLTLTPIMPISYGDFCDYFPMLNIQYPSSNSNLISGGFDIDSSSMFA